MVLAIGNTMVNCIRMRSLLLNPEQSLPANTERIHTHSCEGKLTHRSGTSFSSTLMFIHVFSRCMDNSSKNLEQ